TGINQPFLLHGDLGFHNFIFQGNELHGVIDPAKIPNGFPFANISIFNIAAIIKPKGNPLGILAGLIGGINVLNIPLVLLAYFQFPEWLPFVVAMLIGVHFIPYVWIYESKSYGLLSVGTVFVTSVCGIK
ncbi:DUF7010 family protein, partial [Bacillus sp. D-CC]